MGSFFLVTHVWSICVVLLGLDEFRASACWNVVIVIFVLEGSGPLPWERGSGTSWPGETADRSKAASWRRAQRPGPGQAAPRRPRGSGLDECRRSSLSSKWRRLQQDIPPLPDEFEFSQALQIFVPGVMLL
uniref:Uncharacterized protein n=1 Tax=Aegilops tauschii TaxID=37682 RepID=M8C997_AEGTA